MKRNLLLTSMFLMLSFFISACSDGDSDGESSPASYPVAEKDNTGSPINFDDPYSLYGEYQILHYEEKKDGMHVSNNCPDSKCKSIKLEGGSLILLNEIDDLVNTDTRGILNRSFNYNNSRTQFVINKSAIVENYTTSKENPKPFSYTEGDNVYEITFNGTYDKTVGVFKPENDKDKLKIEMKATNKSDPNTITRWMYLVVKKISDEPSPVASYPVAEKDNTGSPIDFSNPDSLYGEYQILHYEEKKSGEGHLSNNCPDVKCRSMKLEGGSLILRNQIDNLVNTDTRGILQRSFNYNNSRSQFVINKSAIVENYTTSKENPKPFSYGEGDNVYEITFNGTYDKDTVGVFKPENDTDKLKIEVKVTNKSDPNTITRWVYLVVKKISDNQN